MPYPFKQIFAVDPNNLDIVAADSEVLIFAPGDTSRTPLAITDLTGVPLANPITTNEHGFGPAFIADIPQVAWEGGGFSNTMESYEGLRDEAVAAADTARAALASADLSAESAATAASTAAAQVATELSGALNTVQQAAADAAAAAGLVGAPADDAMATVLGSENSQARAALHPVFVRKGELVINVMDCGAVGDGTTDDMAAFTLACTQARTSKREVYVPAGKYYIPGEVDISGVVIRGDLSGYYNRDGSVIVGNGTGITFNQVSTALGSITMGLHGLRFENVETALRLSYSIYSHVTDVSVIDATGNAIILGDNTIIGPIWNVFERVKANSINGYGLVLQGKDWCNSNLFDTCYLKGTTGAVRINSFGGFGAVDNIFRNTEITGTGPGYVFDGITQATTIESGYIEPKGPAVVLRNTANDLQLQGNVYGNTGNDVPGYGPRFIDHQAGNARVRIIGGWVTTNAGARQDNLDFVGSNAPGSLSLEYVTEPSQSIGSTGFRLHNPAILSAATRIQRGDLALEKHSAPALELRYPDGTRPFRIVRNGTQGGTDFGVAFTNGGIQSFFISNLGRLTLNEDLASSKTVAATALGSVVRRLAIRDESGNVVGYMPIYNTIT